MAMRSEWSRFRGATCLYQTQIERYLVGDTSYKLQHCSVDLIVPVCTTLRYRPTSPTAFTLLIRLPCSLGSLYQLPKPLKSTVLKLYTLSARAAISTDASRPTPWNWWGAIFRVSMRHGRSAELPAWHDQFFDCMCLLPSCVALSGSSDCDPKYSRAVVALPIQHQWSTTGVTPSNIPPGLRNKANARSRTPIMLHTGQNIGCVRRKGRLTGLERHSLARSDTTYISLLVSCGGATSVFQSRKCATACDWPP
jgi:hypothetical protein